MLSPMGRTRPPSPIVFLYITNARSFFFRCPKNGTLDGKEGAVMGPRRPQVLSSISQLISSCLLLRESREPDWAEGAARVLQPRGRLIKSLVCRGGKETVSYSNLEFLGLAVCCCALVISQGQEVVHTNDALRPCPAPFVLPRARDND